MKTEEIKRGIGNVKAIDAPAAREIYSHDIGDIPPMMSKALFKTLPDLVVQPENIDDIKTALIFANEHKISVIPRGAASWGFGGVVPTNKGIVIDLSPFRKILSLDIANKSINVEAGTRWSDIDILAKKHGLCLMTYPSSKFSTVGGWISTGGYGINSYKYGHLSQQIISITVVTATGEIKRLTPSDREFNYFISTEGAFGIVVEAVLKLRDIPEGSYPHLLYFGDDKTAFEFIAKFVDYSVNAHLNPNVIRFLDENQLSDINMIMRTGIFKKSAGVLLEFSSFTDDEQFSKYMIKQKIEEAPRYAASYLWNERLFGMKTKRLGPTILASEIIIPVKSAAAYIQKAKKIGSHFGVEVTIDSYIIDGHKALIMSNFLCDSRKKKYYISLPLVSMLTKTAVSLGAEPYGLGLWNAAFINHLFNSEKKRGLLLCKAQLDPNNIMNRGKFFSYGLTGISRIVFNPSVFSPLMSLMAAISPVIGEITTIFLGKHKKVDNLDYEISLHACAKCGNCMAECPAYLITKNEAVTAKGKISLAKKLLNKETVTQEEANNAFLCMHCKACEEICQTNLELMKLWDALETRLENQFGRPENKIVEFLKKVDASTEYWDMVELNNLPTTSKH
jgi:FAD/FMN-containing dehydrogenase/ferredoxin